MKNLFRLVFLFSCLLIVFTGFSQDMIKKERLIAHSMRTPYAGLVFTTDTAHIEYPTIYAWDNYSLNDIYVDSLANRKFSSKTIYEDFGQLGWFPLTKFEIKYQNDGLQKTLTEKEYNLIDDKWSIKHKIIAEYRNNLAPKLIKHFYPIDGSLEETSQVSYSYDNNKLKEHITTKVDTNGQIIETTRTRYNYSKDTTLTIWYQYMPTYPQYLCWVKEKKYDKNGNNIFQFDYFINSPDSSITHYRDLRYTDFDSLNRIKSDIELRYNLQTLEYDTIGKRIDSNIYTFDQRGNLLERIWINNGDLEYKQTYKYNANNKIIENVNYTPHSSFIWKPSTKTVNKYNATNQLIETMSYTSVIIDTPLIHNYRYQFQYTKLGNIKTTIVEKYDRRDSIFAFDHSYYYYYEPYFSEDINIDIKSEITTTTYPNPFTNSVNFIFEATEIQDAALQIIDINGRVIDQAHLKTQLGVNNYTWDNHTILPGIYIAKLNIGEKCKTIKLVKQ